MHSGEVIVDVACLLALGFLQHETTTVSIHCDLNPSRHAKTRIKRTETSMHSLSWVSRPEQPSAPCPADAQQSVQNQPRGSFNSIPGKSARQRTQHRRHYNLARVLLLLVRTTDSKIGDRLQADGVEAGRRGALGRHGCGWRGASIERSGRIASWMRKSSEDAPVEWLFLVSGFSVWRFFGDFRSC